MKLEKDIDYEGWRKMVNGDKGMEKELFNFSLPSSWESWKLYLRVWKIPKKASSFWSHRCVLARAFKSQQYHLNEKVVSEASLLRYCQHKDQKEII